MKQIIIRVVPNASKNEVIPEEDGSLKVRVTAKATDGKANMAVIEVLAEHFRIKRNQVQILRGEKSRDKLISLEF